MENNKQLSTRRVGTVTCGMALIVFGALFLLRTVFPMVNLLFVFRLWPCIFIMLGIEILIGNFKHASSIVYDKGGVFLLLLLMLFAMVMGMIDEWMLHLPEHAGWYTLKI